MRKLFFKLLLLITLPVLVMILLVFIVPPDKTYAQFLVFSQRDKDVILRHTESPRVIFVGGSNLSFGLNSALIKDSLGLNPVNTGIHASIGLKYMLSHFEEFIRKGDIIVISPEYQQFFGDFANGEKELLTIVADVAPESINQLDFRQFYKQIESMPGVAYKKVKMIIKDNILPKDSEGKEIIGIYDRRAFNEFGDAYIHWGLPKEKVLPFGKINGNINGDVFNSLLKFRDFVNSKNAVMYIAYPCYQDLSFKNALPQIKQVDKKLKEYKFNLLSDPERYSIPDSLIFNTPYHLTKQGADYRTLKIIEDLKKIQNVN